MEPKSPEKLLFIIGKHEKRYEKCFLTSFPGNPLKWVAEGKAQSIEFLNSTLNAIAENVIK